MADDFRPGFKTQCEEIAGELRTELRLDQAAPLDCGQVAEHLAIPVSPITTLHAYGANREAINRLTNPQTGFSAVTVVSGTAMRVFYNPNQPAGRQANSLAHELSHILLEHDPTPAVTTAGERYWDGRQEGEADWLAGTILVPRVAALAWMSRVGDLEGGARHFGVSPALFRWRVNHTGVARQLESLQRRSSRSRTFG